MESPRFSRSSRKSRITLAAMASRKLFFDTLYPYLEKALTRDVTRVTILLVWDALREYYENYQSKNRRLRINTSCCKHLCPAHAARSRRHSFARGGKRRLEFGVGFEGDVAGD